ncbi:hypothetical protein [Ralstonia pickettii]|uniref:hypothetical protein n=1 Tax=Ralstonia pickettii TaxID=329 RepID=UPI0015BB9202|nr:hypothetical protein [Ralstonia pickettii]NWK46470.1 hypothetical protein [Ralstonia pickettii]
MLLTFLYIGTAAAQMLKYESESELMGAAATSPTAGGQVISRLVDKCGAYSDSLRADGDQVLRSWEERHRAYLEENRRVRAQLEAMYSGNPDARKTFQYALEKQLPMLVDKQYETYAAAIDVMQTQSDKAQMCSSYYRAISEKRFDLKVNDPTLAAFLDKRIHARSGTK